jgi:hypothetical protein
VRTTILKINGIPVDDKDSMDEAYKMEFFTDDSMFAIKRTPLTEEQA